MNVYSTYLVDAPEPLPNGNIHLAAYIDNQQIDFAVKDDYSDDFVFVDLPEYPMPSAREQKLLNHTLSGEYALVFEENDTFFGLYDLPKRLYEEAADIVSEHKSWFLSVEFPSLFYRFLAPAICAKFSVKEIQSFIHLFDDEELAAMIEENLESSTK